VELVPVGAPMGSMVRPAAADASRRVSELAAQFGPVSAAAEGCDVLLASGVAHFASRSVAEKLGIPDVYAAFCPFILPSPHHAPPAGLLPGGAFPPEVTDNRDGCFAVGEVNHQALFARVAATVRTDGTTAAAQLLRVMSSG
jgi:vancomycin aglycone glucosyltransferase